MPEKSYASTPSASPTSPTTSRSTTNGTLSLDDLAVELRKRIDHTEAVTGRAIKKSTLARKLHVSVSSVYAYLDGTTLPSRSVLDALLRELRVPGPELGRLTNLRDALADRRRSRRKRSTPRADSNAEPIAFPCELPPDVRGFTGRAEQLSRLDALLAGREKSTAVTIAVVSGTAGAGKTTTVVHWAHQVRDQFPDGLLYADLQGFGPDQPMAPADVLGMFLRGLGLADEAIPDDLAERAARYRSLLDRKRALVVLDNASSDEQVRHLLPNSPSCFVVVTSRSTLSGLVARHGAERIAVDSLPLSDAVTLLRTVLGDGRVDADQSGAVALAERCARLPLAIRVCADLVSTRGSLPLAELSAELERHRLDLFSAGGDERTEIRAVFSWSYHHLPEEAALVFRLLGLHPGQDIDVYALAALADLDVSEAQFRIDDLLRANLVEEIARNRYRMHELLRDYAREQTPDPEQANAALARLFDYYVHAAVAALDVLAPHDLWRVKLVRKPFEVQRFADRSRALRWIETERPNLVACVDLAAEVAPEQALDLATTLVRYLTTTAHFTDAFTVFGRGLHVAQRHGATAAEGQLLRGLGVMHLRLGNNEQAREHLDRALSVHRVAGNRAGEAAVLTVLGIVADACGQYRETIARMQEAHRILGDLGLEPAQALSLTNIAIGLWRIGRYTDALENLRQALTVADSIDDDKVRAFAHYGFGVVYERQRRYDDALEHLDRALAIFVRLGDRYAHIEALDSLATACLGRGDVKSALSYVECALSMCQEARSGNLESRVLNTRGMALGADERLDEALRSHRQALALADKHGERYERARAYDGLARIHVLAGHLPDAVAPLRKAADLYSRLDVPEATHTRARLRELELR